MATITNDVDDDIHNKCRNSCGEFSFSISGHTHEFILYAMLFCFCDVVKVKLTSVF